MEKLKNIKIRSEIHSGDIGYIIYLHGKIYSEEYNYGIIFDTYVTNSFYDFIINYNEDKGKLWIAEKDDVIVGAVGIVDRGEKAQLRWFILEKECRGLGLGKILLNNAIDYCKTKKYKSVYLDTTSELDAAIEMYKKMGFVKISEKENKSWRNDVKEIEMELIL